MNDRGTDTSVAGRRGAALFGAFPAQPAVPRRHLTQCPPRSETDRTEVNRRLYATAQLGARPLSLHSGAWPGRTQAFWHCSRATFGSRRRWSTARRASR